MPNLKGVNVEALMKLRNQVDERLLFVAIGSAWELPSRSSATCCTGSAHERQEWPGNSNRCPAWDYNGLLGRP